MKTPTLEYSSKVAFSWGKLRETRMLLNLERTQTTQKTWRMYTPSHFLQQKNKLKRTYFDSSVPHLPSPAWYKTCNLKTNAPLIKLLQERRMFFIFVVCSFRSFLWLNFQEASWVLFLSCCWLVAALNASFYRLKGHHSRLQRLGSFWSATSITTSGQVQFDSVWFAGFQAMDHL